MSNKMIKPSGVEVDVNDDSLEYALSLGWKVKKAVVKKPKEKAKK